jgi:hypothetical protein
MAAEGAAEVTLSAGFGADVVAAAWLVKPGETRVGPASKAKVCAVRSVAATEVAVAAAAAAAARSACVTTTGIPDGNTWEG